jgi:hypothetical protein
VSGNEIGIVGAKLEEFKRALNSSDPNVSPSEYTVANDLAWNCSEAYKQSGHNGVGLYGEV